MSLKNELRNYRAAYGRGAEIFASTSGGTADEYWYALSGVGHPDYNMALVSDGDVNAHTIECIDALIAGGQPGVIMLAGKGLAAAQVLADRGWVTVSSMPLMRMTTPPDSPWHKIVEQDPRTRRGTVADLPRAREIIMRSFGVDEATARVVFSEELLARPDVHMLVTGEPDEIGCVSITHQEGGVATNWALATDPAMRRRGYVTSMLPKIAVEANERWPGAALVGLPMPAAESAIGDIGTIREYWQVWSRPRWRLASA